MGKRDDLITALQKGDEEAALALWAECLASMGANKEFEGGVAARWVCAALDAAKNDLAWKMVEAMESVVELGDKERLRILERAANRGQLEVVRALMKPGDGERRLIRGFTLMMVAACGGQLEMLEFLLPRSDASARDDDGYAALAHAARTSRLECVRWCLNHGREQPEGGVSALEAALGPHSYRDADVVALLLERDFFVQDGAAGGEGFWARRAAREPLDEKALVALDAACLRIRPDAALSVAAKARSCGLALPGLYARVEKIELESQVGGGVASRKLSL